MNIFLIKLVSLNLLQFRGYKKFFSAHSMALPACRFAVKWLTTGNNLYAANDNMQ